MGLANIILRTLTHAPQTTKNDDLTWPEMDQNIIELIEAIDGQGGVGSVSPYNAGTTYPLLDSLGTPVPTYVSYDGNIYYFISGSPQIGITPGTPAAVGIWQLSSEGALNHVQNSDTYLALGTATEVSAANLWSLLNEQVITITPVAFMALVAAGTLKPNRLYYFGASSKHLVRSLSATAYSNEAHKLVSVPNYTDYNQYDFGGTYAIGDHVTWLGSVWRNLTAANPGTAPQLDVVNWVLVAAFASPYYHTKAFSTKINISDAGTVTDYELTDDAGNVFSGFLAYLLKNIPDNIR